jgi:hypothetical protein
MKVHHLAALLCTLVTATPALAEKLTFDYRLYPPLKAALDSNRPELLESDQHNPKYLFNRIAIQGRSAKDWSEAIEIVARLKAPGMTDAANWLEELRQRASSNCISQFTTISEDAISVTFERHSTGCGRAIAQTGIYRIVAGRSSLFLLAAQYRGEMSEATRKQWLDLMASAHLES